MNNTATAATAATAAAATAATDRIFFVDVYYNTSQFINSI